MEIALIIAFTALVTASLFSKPVPVNEVQTAPDERFRDAPEGKR